ncbi:MAG: chromosome partitioning protein [Mariniblastus sp.]|jgi:chromosome partitioning protein
MRSIAIINQKGGVGKTTTAVNLSAALAEAGNRVWLIDLDPQAHASLHLGFAMEEEYLSVYDVLTADASLDEVRHQVDENLWLTPSHIDLAAAEMELAGAVGREIILQDRMADVTEKFDYVIFDCPPSLGILTLNALTTANEVFLPLQPHFLALHGLSKLLRTIQLVGRRLNPELRLTSVVYCLFESGTRLANEVVEDVEVFFEEQRDTESVWSDAYSFDTRIRRNIRLAEAPSYGQSIFQYANDSNGAQDYRSLAQEVIQQTDAIRLEETPDTDQANQLEEPSQHEAEPIQQPVDVYYSEQSMPY